MAMDILQASQSLAVREAIPVRLSAMCGHKVTAVGFFGPSRRIQP